MPFPAPLSFFPCRRQGPATRTTAAASGESRSAEHMARIKGMMTVTRVTAGDKQTNRCRNNHSPFFPHRHTCGIIEAFLWRGDRIGKAHRSRLCMVPGPRGGPPGRRVAVERAGRLQFSGRDPVPFPLPRGGAVRSQRGGASAHPPAAPRSGSDHVDDHGVPRQEQKTIENIAGSHNSPINKGQYNDL